jgi:hypothetical protein
MIEAHARFDAADSPHLLRWLTLAAGLPSAAAIVEQRLKRDPKELLALRAQQDVSSGEAHSAVCTRQQALAQQTPADADLQYLSIRCMEETPARGKAFVAAHDAHRNNAWLAWAAGQEHAEQARWQQAYDGMEIAFEALPSLADDGRIAAARILRVLGKRGQLVFLQRKSEKLRNWLAVESGDDKELDGPVRAYAQLAKGQLEQAVETSKPAAGMAARILRLAAASKGASDELVKRALALPADQGIDGNTVWSAIALSAVHGQDYAPLLETAKAVGGEHTDQLLGFVAADRLGTEHLLKAAQGLDPIQRGHALVMACIVLGKKAPLALAKEASALLFAMERPYLGE